MQACQRHVRFPLDSRYTSDKVACPLRVIFYRSRASAACPLCH